MSVLSLDDRRALIRRGVVISLFSWRRASDSDPIDDDSRFGWWGDTYPSVGGDMTGSRLYLLRRRTLTTAVIRDAIAFAEEALMWLTADGHAERVVIDASRRGTDGLALHVVVFLSDDDPLDIEFDDIWRVIHAV